MKLCFRIVFLLLLVAGTLAQDLFDLSDALDNAAPTPPKPKEQPKAPEEPKNEDEPKLEATKKPHSGDSDGFGFNLEDAFGPDPNPKTDKPAVKPPSGGGGGGSFDDSDLFDIGGGDYKPDKGQGGRRPVDPNYDNQGGADQPPDPDLPWGQILKMLNANMPEEFYMWMSNLKKVITPLLQRAMDLLNAMP
ncbi:CD99 molecule isoform X2 [Acanthochromis polyacanthus]|uniref:CD99 molecule isoform X2 n=1 Tax=Acanthochromis polyacanthus TaxID=80966 RepID=UPI0022341D51|nr:CD99 molecule isoform X2 [Acanthochromis polyacanthus]